MLKHKLTYVLGCFLLKTIDFFRKRVLGVTICRVSKAEAQFVILKSEYVKRRKRRRSR